MAADFLLVECSECENRQRIFSRPAGKVECLVCSEVLARPSGGRAELEAGFVEALSPE